MTTHSHADDDKCDKAAPAQDAEEPWHARPTFYDSVRTASDEIVQLMLTSYGDGSGRLHAEDAIAATAALTGEFALRSTFVPFPEPGKLVAGDAQDGILFVDQGEHTAWSMIARAAAVAGLKPGEFPDLPAIVAHTHASFGKGPFPALTVPERHRPRMDPLDAGPRLRKAVRAIADRNHLTTETLVVVLGWSVGALVIMTRQSIPPAVSVRLAAEVMIAMARVAPRTEPLADPRPH